MDFSAVALVDMSEEVQLRLDALHDLEELAADFFSFQNAVKDALRRAVGDQYIHVIGHQSPVPSDLVWEAVEGPIKKNGVTGLPHKCMPPMVTPESFR